MGFCWSQGLGHNILPSATNSSSQFYIYGQQCARCRTKSRSVSFFICCTHALMLLQGVPNNFSPQFPESLNF